MQIYWNKRNRLHKKNVQLPGTFWDTNMAAVLLFHNMTDLTSSQKDLYVKFPNTTRWSPNLLKYIVDEHRL